jgi:hypothetical protein
MLPYSRPIPSNFLPSHDRQRRLAGVLLAIVHSISFPVAMHEYGTNTAPAWVVLVSLPPQYRNTFPGGSIRTVVM